MTVEREFTSELYRTIGNSPLRHLRISIPRPIRLRGLKWSLVLVVAMLAALGLVTSPVVKQPSSPAAAVASIETPIDLDARPGSYIGANFAWAKLSRGKLIGANLQRASLLGTNLSEADLSQAHLDGALMLGTNLNKACLQAATLRRADLHWADLGDADLRKADLRWANLAGVNLQYANLQGADLAYANLEKAHLRGATLPDGSTWTWASDLERFTHPGHPDFWPASERYPAPHWMRHFVELSVTR